MDRFQFSLRSLLLLVSACACVAAAARGFGFRVVADFLIVCGVLAAFMFVWSLVYLRAPEFTKYATVFGVMGVWLGMLWVGWIFHAREESRYVRASHKLKRIGYYFEEARELHPQIPTNEISSEGFRLWELEQEMLRP